MRQRRVLYLGANPPGTVQLGLDEEVRAIRQELRGARYRCFDLAAYWASEANDLIRELRASTTTIVHLSGHACKPGGWAADPAGGYRDALAERVSDAEGGGALVLHARDGTVQVVPYALVKKIFELAGSSVKLVVLTACSTEPLASLLLEHVDCAIGIDGLISDRAALEFSKGLYAALGDGASVEQAFQAGCLAIECAGLPDAERPKLRWRDGVDASHVVLAAVRRRRKARSRRQPGLASRRPGKHGARRGRGRTHRRAKLGVLRAGTAALYRKRGRRGVARARQPAAIRARSAGDSS